MFNFCSFFFEWLFVYIHCVCSCGYLCITAISHSAFWYQHTLRNKPEERGSYLHHGMSLKSCKLHHLLKSAVILHFQPYKCIRLNVVWSYFAVWLPCIGGSLSCSQVVQVPPNFIYKFCEHHYSRYYVLPSVNLTVI